MYFPSYSAGFWKWYINLDRDFKMLSRPVCTWRAVSRRNVAEPKDLLKFQKVIVWIDLSTFCVKKYWEESLKVMFLVVPMVGLEVEIGELWSSQHSVKSNPSNPHGLLDNHIHILFPPAISRSTAICIRPPQESPTPPPLRFFPSNSLVVMQTCWWVHYM